MSAITLDAIQRYVDTLPEPAREKYIRQNWELIRLLYDREKQYEKENDHDENENT